MVSEVLGLVILSGRSQSVRQVGNTIRDTFADSQPMSRFQNDHSYVLLVVLDETQQFAGNDRELSRQR
jgi:hypothetical protein